MLTGIFIASFTIKKIPDKPGFYRVLYFNLLYRNRNKEPTLLVF